MTCAQSTVFLHPGDYHFDCVGARIDTLLGSCVAVTVWHPLRRIGGMCHFLLPARGRAGSTSFDGRYADEAVSLLVDEMRAVDSCPTEYEARLYGGGNMFPEMTKLDATSIGHKNASAARQVVHDYGIPIIEESLKGTGHRNIRFDVTSGRVTMKHTRLDIESEQCRRCKVKSLCYNDGSCERSTGC